MTAPATATTVVLLVDAPALLAYAYRSVPLSASTTASGQPTNAVSGFLTTISDILVAEVPTHVAVVFDGAGLGRRAEIVPGYRAHHTPPELAQQEPVLRDLLHTMQIRVLDAPAGLEAGDLIASLAAGTDAPVVIVSADDRMLQCATSTATVISPAPGRRPDRLTPRTIQARHGVTLQTYVDYLALRGDRRRGLMPVPGVGDRTAAAWLAEAGTLDTLLARLDNRSRASTMLRAHAAKVATYRTVLRFATDVTVPQLDELTIPRLTDRTGIQQRLNDLQLPGLATQILTALGAPAPHAAPAQPISPGDVATWLSDHARGRGRHALALTGDQNNIATVAITTPAGAIGYFDLTDTTADDRAAFGTWLADPAAAKAVHDTKAMIHALRPHGWHLAGVDIDVALAGYLLHPGGRDFTLTTLATRHLTGDAFLTHLGEVGTLFAGNGDPAAVADAALIAQLADTLSAELAHAGMARLHTGVELPTAATLAAIEHRGVAVDAEQLAALRDEFTATADAAAVSATEILGHPVNIGSTQQLQKALFEDLGLPRTRRIKSGYSTAAEELTRLLKNTGHPFLQQLLDYRSAAKLASMIDGLLKHVAADGRIHTTLQQTTVETGRLSSEAPNLQNIPIRTDDGARIREAFVPGTGYDLVLAADYSQIEMRIMAHASGDRHLIDAFTSGEDMHRYVASLVFGVPVSEVTQELRRRVKAISYGLAYGQSVRGLATELGLPLAEARDHYNAYFARFGRVRDYLDGLVEKARRTGYTETLLGRRRYLPDLNSSNPQTVEAAERAALNAPIQGTAADIIKLAMTRIDTALADAGLRARMVLQVHDELLFELPADEEPALAAIVEQIMPAVVELAVPLDVSIGTGCSWAQAHR
ncbi:DNA polymerase I [Nocardia pseudovaccinii]|uniref:DNA polymerase I n=1 Tax=Nocardia pseudovaccinii TaxID=189540 RepID=UPI0007A4D4F9|nr:DNA polymerase I [Nocardia pseudovaccinii]